MVCAMSCHLSHYGLFTKCVTPNVTHVHFTIYSATTSRATAEINFCTFSKIFAKTWHALFHLTRIATHPTHNVTSFSITLARQIKQNLRAVVSCQCEARFSPVLFAMHGESTESD